MAFLRAYMMGDPGLGSFFKKLGKKISLKNLKKVGRVLMPVAGVANSSIGRRIGANFLPGGAGIAAQGLFQGQFPPGYGAAAGGGTPPVIVGGGMDWKSILSSAGREAASRLLQQYQSGAGPGMGVGPDFGGVVSGSSSTAPAGRRRKLTAAEREALGMRRAPRMRATNVQALRRAVRRVKSFARIARQTIVLDKRVKLRKRGRR